VEEQELVVQHRLLVDQEEQVEVEQDKVPHLLLV
jgi:hypothetical protein